MKLPNHSKSPWIATHKGRPFPRLESDLAVDVAIVGGGITGLTAATLLKRAGLSVAVIEAGRVAEGVSGATTAHLTEAFDRSYADLIADFGEDGARLAAESGRAALRQIAAFVRERSIECDFTRLPAFQYAEDAQLLPELEAERAAAARIGVELRLTHDVPLPFAVAGALRWDDQAQFHPRRYLLPLALAIPGGGSHVFEQTRVVDVEGGAPCRVVTEAATVSARDVVVATHAPLDSMFLQTKIAQYRSYVLALRLKPGATPPEGLFWDTEDPYHYIRSQATDKGPLLLVGGEDHKTGQEADALDRFEALLDFARRRFPVTSVAYRWSAQVVEPVDGLPFIGRDLCSPHVYVATGYSGTGMTLGTLAGMLDSELILGRESPWKDLYDANRIKPVASIVDFVKENLSFPVHLVADRLKGPDVASLARVAKGEGKIVEVAGEKTAVFRDEHGLLHAVSPVCTHMRCLVGWNDAEKSWDCPCHGSRFDTDGKVLDGPAAQPLESRRDEAVGRDQPPAPSSSPPTPSTYRPPGH
jgi:glycine/D-amino acid oxidase-like deaminating enzyme/nitrite reductase/ring-hydroxylating ferredoxin subunit